MAPDSRQVGRVGDFLVTEELRPSAVRRVGEVLGRAFTRSVPARRWLRNVLPEKGPATVGVPKPDRHWSGGCACARQLLRECEDALEPLVVFCLCTLE
jgi:hypothetical protein